MAGDIDTGLVLEALEKSASGLTREQLWNMDLYVERHQLSHAIGSLVQADRIHKLGEIFYAGSMPSKERLRQIESQNRKALLEAKRKLELQQATEKAERDRKRHEREQQEIKESEERAEREKIAEAAIKRAEQEILEENAERARKESAEQQARSLEPQRFARRGSQRGDVMLFLSQNPNIAFSIPLIAEYTGIPSDRACQIMCMEKEYVEKFGSGRGARYKWNKRFNYPFEKRTREDERRLAEFEHIKAIKEGRAKLFSKPVYPEESPAQEKPKAESEKQSAVEQPSQPTLGSIVGPSTVTGVGFNVPKTLLEVMRSAIVGSSASSQEVFGALKILELEEIAKHTKQLAQNI